MIVKQTQRLNKVLVSRFTPLLTTQSLAPFTGNTKKLDEKEKGDELLYFKRQEGNYLWFYIYNVEERLKKLQEKMKKQGKLEEPIPSDIQHAMQTLD